MENDQIEVALSDVLKQIKKSIRIPIGISNRHIHLSECDFRQLFPGESVEILKELRQPGFFAAKQTVTICGPKGKLERVRLLLPFRGQTQVELSQTDARQLGIEPPICLSGQLESAVEVTIQSNDTVIIRKAAIIAKRHLHLNPTDAVLLGFKAGDSATVVIDNKERRTIYDDVVIRPSEGAVLELHIDTDEANAANCNMSSIARFI